MGSQREFARLNERRASIVRVGGFRPTGDPFASHFGLQPLAVPGEGWPARPDGAPLRFVCQLNLTRAPFVPASLRDVALLTFFAGDLPGTEEAGGDWCLRTYTSLEGLVALEVPPGAALDRGFECAWEEVRDYPCYEDPGLVMPPGFDTGDMGEGELENVPATKVGGWASTIQSEPWWDYRAHPARPAYVMQVDSEPKVHLQWGDGGTVYLARGTAPGSEREWFLDVQCH